MILLNFELFIVYQERRSDSSLTQHNFSHRVNEAYGARYCSCKPANRSLHAQIATQAYRRLLKHFHIQIHTRIQRVIESVWVKRRLWYSNVRSKSFGWATVDAQRLIHQSIASIQAFRYVCIENNSEHILNKMKNTAFPLDFYLVSFGLFRTVCIEQQLCRLCETMISPLHMAATSQLVSTKHMEWEKNLWIHACLVYYFKINNNILGNFVCVERCPHAHTHTQYPTCVQMMKNKHKLPSIGSDHIRIFFTRRIQSSSELGTQHSSAALPKWKWFGFTELVPFFTLCARRIFDCRRALWATLRCCSALFAWLQTPQAWITQPWERSSSSSEPNVMEPMDIVQIHTHTHTRSYFP